MHDLAGKVVAVTGGSTGIGRSTVETLAKHGASVVFCTHDEATLASAHAYFAAEGLPVTGVAADVRSAHDMRALMTRTVELHSGLDALICCAGIQTYGTAESTPEDEWHTVLDTNLTGIFLAAKYALPHLRARGGGAIVNVSSVQGMTPAPHVLGYAVSKAGIDALTRSMAVDHAADGIRVNSVAPGPVATPLQTTGTVEPPARVDPPDRPQLPPGRVAQPQEIAELIVFLASPAASYVTGATYLADGGMMAGPGPLLLG
jgi:NAD(P)-dependent dehydrogenase (short-subunit alcohol dehydrogenase family)